MGKKKQLRNPLDLNNCEKLNSLKPADQRMITEPPLREFDDLTEFETFIRDETWDNDFDFIHAKLNYYPPFVLTECHDDLEKIKNTSNKNLKKFKRQLQHHIKRHLMHDLETVAGYPMHFSQTAAEELFKNWKLKYQDDTLHGFTEEEEQRANRHWKIEMEVMANNENAMVEVDFRSMPV